MKVTDIQKQVKKEGRYSVFVDGKFAFGITESGLINSGLRIGLELDKEALEDYKNQASEYDLQNKVMALIARRPRSRWEVEDYLKRKKTAPEQIDKLIGNLEDRGYIDDHDFAIRWVETRRLLKPISKRKLTLELRQKRVASEIIQEVLSEDETADADVIKELIDKKRKQTRYQDSQKLMAYLTRQGFAYEDIKRALESD